MLKKMNNKNGVITMKCSIPNEHHNNEYSISFDGHNEGSCIGYENFGEVEEAINKILINYPKAKIINEIAYGKVQDKEKSGSQSFSEPKNSKEKPKKQQNSEDNEEFKKAEENAKKEFEKSLKIISEQENQETIEKLFKVMKDKVHMVARGQRRGLILYGNAGLGKSYNTQKAFSEEGVSFKYMSGHITNLALYQFLYDNRKEHIILDDVNILDNEINLNMLKSALNDNVSVVSYSTTSSKIKVPSQFVFEGSITILLNKKPRNNDSLDAVESRILVHELKFNYSEKLLLMKQISLMPYKNTTQEDRNFVFNWIKDNTNVSTKNFNLRDLFKVFEFYIYSQSRKDIDVFNCLANSVFPKNEEMDLIIQGLGLVDWCERTGKSRAGYFRYKKLIKLETYQIKPININKMSAELLI